MARFSQALSRRVQSWRECWLVSRARLHRARLKDRVPLCIGVTGSAGKTTTCDLLESVLAGRGVCRCRLDYNGIEYTARAVLGLRPGPAYAVQELGVQAPGEMARQVDLWRPRVGIVTRVGADHRQTFRTAEATALEKGGLVAALPADGLAVLNADDPLVLAMRERTAARVVTFGLAPSADVRALEVHAAWPGRLALTVACGGDTVRVETQLVGAHWVPAVLAALATAHGLGLPAAEAAGALARVPPAQGRMSPHEVRGVTFVRDDWKAPLWTLEATQDFLRAARASRRIAVIGTVSDYAGHASKKYRALARKFLDVAELTLFVGPMAHCVERVAAEAGPDRLRMFARSYDARAFLAEALRPGDLVLLKGSVRADHLPRLVADYAGERVRCWREQCGKPYYCDVCRHRRSDFVPPPA